MQMVGVNDTQIDSIQYLNFDQKMIQFNIQFNIISQKFNSKNYSIQTNLIQKIIQFKKFQEYSIQNLIQNVEIGRIQFNNIFIQ